MPDEVLILLVVGVIAWALVELLQSDKGAVRALPKWVWGLVIVLLAPFGPVLWFLFGRPRPDAVPAATRPAVPLRGRRAYVSRPAPDDDPEFLALLNARADQQRRLKRLEDDLQSDEGSTEADPERPE